jgi:hypothetical protein
VQDGALYQQAKAFATSISKGDVKVKHGEETTAQSDKGTHY